jgi:hypothetical protein
LNQPGALCSLAGTTSKDGSVSANTRVANLRVADVLDFLVQNSNAVFGQFQIKDPVMQPSTNNDNPVLWRGVRIRVTTDGFFKSVPSRDPTAPEALDIT